MQDSSQHLPDSLAGKLQKEAEKFLARANTQNPPSGDLFRTVHNLVGIRIDAPASDNPQIFAEACQHIRQSIEAERRKARKGSALYNSNRHIALHQCLAGLNALKKIRA